ncbi:hypothetical protein J6590_033894 [Homalodisca vitripennis]|nr:hypothetical protein J6590_033894 [Homalodisca vitripennis]
MRSPHHSAETHACGGEPTFAVVLNNSVKLFNALLFKSKTDTILDLEEGRRALKSFTELFRTTAAVGYPPQASVSAEW